MAQVDLPWNDPEFTQFASLCGCNFCAQRDTRPNCILINCLKCLQHGLALAVSPPQGLRHGFDCFSSLATWPDPKLPFAKSTELNVKI